MTWRVVVQGQTYETNLEELKQWVREGRILPGDQVYQPGVGWRAAGQLSDLQGWFPPGAMSAPPPGAGIPPPAYGPSPYAPTMPASYPPPYYAPPPDSYAPDYGQVGAYPPSFPTSLPGAPAGVGKRFLGLLTDGFLMFLCALPGFVIYLSAAVASRGDSAAGQAFGGYLLMYLGAMAYAVLCAYMTSRTGGSPGKKLLGMVVLRDDGQYLSFGAALLREFLKNVFSNICLLLNAWLLFDPQRQQLYDKIVHANVYDAP